MYPAQLLNPESAMPESLIPLDQPRQDVTYSSPTDHDVRVTVSIGGRIVTKTVTDTPALEDRSEIRDTDPIAPGQSTET